MLAADPESGETGPREVTHLWVHQDTVIDLEVGDGQVVTTTEDHPFWNATDKQWQRAHQLDRRDQLLTSDGVTVIVGGLLVGTERAATAYSLTVADLHTYYVQAGDTPSSSTTAALVAGCGVRRMFWVWPMGG